VGGPAILVRRAAVGAERKGSDMSYWPQADMPAAPINPRSLGKADIALA